MKKLEQFISREVMGNHVLMPVGLTTQKFSGMILTTETGAFIWEHIEEVSSAEEMANLLTEEFEVSYEEALADVTALFDNFKQAGWIE